LLSRLTADQEYSPIAYFIFFVLFKVGLLNQTLETARNWQKVETDYGLSELLKILEGLLRFEHH